MPTVHRISRLVRRRQGSIVSSPRAAKSSSASTMSSRVLSRSLATLRQHGHHERSKSLASFDLQRAACLIARLDEACRAYLPPHSLFPWCRMGVPRGLFQFTHFFGQIPASKSSYMNACRRINILKAAARQCRTTIGYLSREWMHTTFVPIAVIGVFASVRPTPIPRLMHPSAGFLSGR